MKYFLGCLFIIAAGFFIGRKTPVSSITQTLLPRQNEAPDVHPKSDTAHSADLVAQLYKNQTEAEDIKSLAQGPALEPLQIQKLVLQMQNPKTSFLLRRQAALTLHRQVDESTWRELVSKMDPRLQEMISLNPPEILEGYIRAAAR